MHPPPPPSDRPDDINKEEEEEEEEEEGRKFQYYCTKFDCSTSRQEFILCHRTKHSEKCFCGGAAVT